MLTQKVAKQGIIILSFYKIDCFFFIKQTRIETSPGVTFCVASVNYGAEIAYKKVEVNSRLSKQSWKST